MELGSLSYYRLILNGTQLAETFLDLWTQMEFLSPKILKMRFSQFENTLLSINIYQTRKG